MASGQAVGSKVIGQYFTKPEYFHSRPSATSGTDPNDSSKTVDQPYNAASSAASNQGVISKKLLDAAWPSEPRPTGKRTNSLRMLRSRSMPLPASGSGLDPHISVANAKLQAVRVAKARGLLDGEGAGGRGSEHERSPTRRPR